MFSSSTYQIFVFNNHCDPDLVLLLSLLGGPNWLVSCFQQGTIFKWNHTSLCPDHSLDMPWLWELLNHMTPKNMPLSQGHLWTQQRKSSYWDEFIGFLQVFPSNQVLDSYVLVKKASASQLKISQRLPNDHAPPQKKRTKSLACFHFILLSMGHLLLFWVGRTLRCQWWIPKSRRPSHGPMEPGIIYIDLKPRYHHRKSDPLWPMKTTWRSRGGFNGKFLHVPNIHGRPWETLTHRSYEKCWTKIRGSRSFTV